MDEKMPQVSLEFDAAPTLTLETEQPAQELQPTPEKKEEAPVLDDSSLSPEKENGGRFCRKNRSEKHLARPAVRRGRTEEDGRFLETALNNVRTKDLGEVGELLSGVVGELRNFEVEEDEKGFFSFFKKTSNKLNNMRAKYEKAEANINKV